ncbi:hypothetical protein IL306_009637 [Fusarium sp. DS 682]|nr:hypothetical protein IL306_009637 [Fusarium sp. DS 682]
MSNRGRPQGNLDSYTPRNKIGGVGSGAISKKNNRALRAPEAPKTLSDDEIKTKLDKKPPNPDNRASLSREIFDLTKQWPWEWTEKFEPEKWSYLDEGVAGSD